MSRKDAAALLAGAPGSPCTTGDILANSDAVTATYRWLAKQHHPDVGGDPELFRRLTAARDLLLAGERP